MKVLHIITDTNFGGAGRYLTYLLPQAEFCGIDIAVACPDGNLGTRLDEMGIRRIPIRGRDVSFSRHLASELIRVIRREKPDLVHTHGVFSGRIAARLTGVRVVYTKHGEATQTNRTVGRRAHGPGRFLKLVNKLAGRLFSDAVIAVSEGVAEGLISSGVDANLITVIRNGVNLSDYKPSTLTTSTSAFAPGHTGLVVGTMARLDREKGLDVLVDAAKVVLSSAPSVRFLIAGAGPLERELKTRIRGQRLDQAVKLTGFVHDAPAFLAGLDVYVAPSRSEGLGLAIIEAMASALPVVGTTAGGIPEVVEDGVTGILVPPGEPKALAQGIVRMLVDPSLARRMGQAGRARAETVFDAGLMAEETVKVYRSVVRYR